MSHQSIASSWSRAKCSSRAATWWPQEEEDGPNRVLWAWRGDDEVVRVLATRDGERVVVGGAGPRARQALGAAGARDEVITALDGRMRRERPVH